MARASKKTAAATGEKSIQISYKPETLLRLDELSFDVESNWTRPEGIDQKSLKDLITSIEVSGQQTPVIVGAQATDGRYPIVAGFRRVAAIVALAGMGKHPGTVRVQELADPSMAVAANLLENEGARQAVSPLGRLHAYTALEAQGYTTSQLASLTGRARDFIADHLRLANGAKTSPELVEAIKAGPEKTGGLAWAVARLVGRFPVTDQPKLVRKVDGLSVLKATEVLKLARNGEEGEEKKEPGEGEGGEGGEGEGKGEKPARASKAEKACLDVLAQATLLAEAVAAQVKLLADEAEGEDDEEEMTKNKELAKFFLGLGKGLAKVRATAAKGAPEPTEGEDAEGDEDGDKE